MRDIFKNRVRNGFTLAEVLITLAIIGVVAALTIPTVVKNYRATELKTQLKEASSILNQSIPRMSFEEGKLSAPENYPRHTFKPALMKYVRVLKDCGLGYADRNKEGNDRPCVPVGESSTYNTYNTYNRTGNITSTYLDDGQFILQNGMYVFIENPGAGNIYMSVDINGYVKKPNLWGHDLFTFQLMDNGTIRPMGAAGTATTGANYCSKSSTNALNGIACTYNALTDEDYFKNLP